MILSLPIAMGWLSSCTPVQEEFSRKRCYVVIDNSIHQDDALASAMNINAPGTFCQIRIVNDKGRQAYEFRNNKGLSTALKYLTALETSRTNIVGQNNAVIVGYGNGDYPFTFYAFDRECPNCFDDQSVIIHSYPITVNENGIGRCPSCKREYNLNIGGIIIKGGEKNDKKLTRFPANTSGPLGVLTVY